MSTITRRLIVFSLVASSSLYFGFIKFDPQTCGSLLEYTGYPFTLAAFAVFVYCLLTVTKKRGTRWVPTPSFWLIPTVCFVLAGFMFMREGPSFKITMDEPLLANVAISMHEHRDTGVREYSLSTEQGSQTVVDKRPFFFSFLVSLIHDLLGVTPNAPFYLNLVLTGLLLLLVFLTVRGSSKAKGGALIAVAAIATHPLFIQNSSSGGFDILNCVMMVTVVLLAVSFYRIPSEDSLASLVFGTILLSYTRYESALFVPAAGILITIKLVSLRKLIIPRLAIFAPILMLPVAWQNQYINGTPEFWELKDTSLSPFGLVYLANNLASAYKYFFAPGPGLASSPFFSSAATIAAVYLAAVACRIGRGLTRNYSFWPLLVIGGTVAFNFALLMSYWWGTLSDVSASRLSLPVLTFGALAIGLAQNQLTANKPNLRWIAPVMIAISAIYSAPVSSRAQYSKLNLQSLQFQWMLNESGIDIGSRDLVIGGLARIFSTHQIPAVSVKRALLKWEAIKLHQELATYDNIFVVQQLHATFEEGRIVHTFNSGNDLGPAFVLETINETSLYPYNLTRVSRLERIKPDAIDNMGGIGSYLEKYGNVAYQAHEQVSPEMRQIWKQSLP